MPGFRLSPDVAIDMGTTNTRIYVKGKGIVVNEASIMVLRGKGKKAPIVAIGDSCEEFIGRANSEYSIIRPIRSGIIVDYENAQILLHYFMTKAIGSRFYFKPRVVVSIPGHVNAVQRQSFINAVQKIGARQIYVVEQSFAAAIGTGLRVYEPQGILAVDIGSGTTEVALISMGGIVASDSIEIAGNVIDNMIGQHLKKRYGIDVTDKVTEQIKFDLTDVREEENLDRIVVVRGRDMATGMPFTQDVKTSEICKAIRPTLMSIITVIRRVLEMTPPELCVDILQNGIYLTGGSSLLPGLDSLIVTELGIPVSVAREAGECTILGAGYLADHFDMLGNRTELMKSR
ncbi:MAG: rod shape-determining protein [Clostridia bacterium]|nr:rod shape-determining protein [Clostridia bacterium]